MTEDGILPVEVRRAPEGIVNPPQGVGNRDLPSRRSGDTLLDPVERLVIERLSPDDEELAAGGLPLGFTESGVRAAAQRARGYAPAPDR